MLKRFASALFALLALASSALALDNTARPLKFGVPWGNAAGSQFIRGIPTGSQIGIQNCAASLNDGFPPLTFVPATSGGCPPFGQDFNGILNQLSAWNRWQALGGSVFYDSSFATSIGGYPKGAVLSNLNTVGQFWISTADNNSNNPDTGGANWVNLSTVPQQTAGFPTSTGSANVQAITINGITGTTTYASLTGLPITFKAGFTNTGAATLNVNTLGAKSIFRYGQNGETALTGNEIVTGSLISVAYDGTQFVLLNNYNQKDRINLCDFGCDPSGGSSNTTAFNNAVAALPSSACGTIYIPAGTFLFSSAPSAVSYPTGTVCDFTVIGAGQDVTVLNFSGSNGLTLTLHNTNLSPNNPQSFHFRDLTFATGHVPGSGFTGLNIGQGTFNNGSYAALSEITRVTFRGNDGYAVNAGNGWLNDLTITNVSNVNIVGAIFQGPGTGGSGNAIQYQGTSSSQIAVVFNVIGSTFNLHTNGLILGDFIQGITVNQSNFTTVTVPISNGAGLSALNSQLVVSNSQFAPTAAGGSSAIAIATAFNDTILVNNLCILANISGQSCFNISKLAQTTIIGNHLFGFSGAASQIAISLGTQSAPSGSTISGNIIGQFSGTSAIGINLAAAQNNAVVIGNKFIGNTQDINNGGTLNYFSGNIYSTGNNGPASGTTTGDALNILATNGSVINTSITGNYAALIRNSHGSAGDNGLILELGANAASDSSSVAILFAGGDGTQPLGSISRNGANQLRFNPSSTQNGATCGPGSPSGSFQTVGGIVIAC